MRAEAQRLDQPSTAYQGGLILDEMSLQEDLQLVKEGNDTLLVGFVDNGPEANMLNAVKAKSQQKVVANKVCIHFFTNFTLHK